MFQCHTVHLNLYIKLLLGGTRREYRRKSDDRSIAYGFRWVSSTT